MVSILTVVILLLFLTYKLDAANYNYYVSSTSGSDSNGDGSSNKPWATIQKAQSSVSKLITTLSPNTYTGNITINIESGIYYGPLQYTLKDSMVGFKNNNYVIYKGDINGNTYIYGGQKIDSLWRNISQYDNPTHTFYRTNLKNETNNIPNNKIYCLFFNNIRMQLSKSSLYTYTNYDINHKIITTNTKMISVENINMILSSNYSNNMMVILYESWTMSYHLIKSIDYDISSGIIKINLETGPYKGLPGGASGNRFYLINNGQYDGFHDYSFYYNITTNNLDIWVPNSINPNDKNNNIYFGKDIEIINIIGNNTNNKVERLKFLNLNVKYSAIDFSSCFTLYSGSCQNQSAAFLSSATIQTIYSSNIHFINVNISLTGGYSVWFNYGSNNCSYSNSYLNNSGAGGIRIGVNARGIVSNDKLTSNILIYNNYILNGGYIFESGCGILAQQTEYTIISNNEIAHFKYTGISVGWTWGYAPTLVNNIKLLNNKIYDIGQGILSDMGGIYTLGEQLNSLVSNNIIHDVYTFNYGGWGTYTDEGSRYIKFENNIIYNTKGAGHHQHYGLDNIFLNNIYAFNELDGGEHDGVFRSSQHDGGGNKCNYKSDPGACSSFIMITNILYTNNTWGYDILGDSSHTYWKNMTTD
eukprot:479461_1